MSPNGAPDPLYVKARRVLLDALEALGLHRQSVVLVGAQAVYLHTGEAHLAVAPFTTDGDLLLDPRTLAKDPLLATAMQAGGFVAANQPGRWLREGVPVDLMVPEALAGGGRRGARLGPHGNQAARRAHGLEAALIDHGPRDVRSLDHADARVFVINVAGPSSLLVSKLVKISERVGDRERNKDALDVFRLLRGVASGDLASTLSVLHDDPLASAVVRQGLSYLEDLFASPAARGNDMLAAAVAALENEATVRASCAALAQELLQLVKPRIRLARPPSTS